MEKYTKKVPDKDSWTPSFCLSLFVLSRLINYTLFLFQLSTTLYSLTFFGSNKLYYSQ